MFRPQCRLACFTCREMNLGAPSTTPPPHNRLANQSLLATPQAEPGCSGLCLDLPSSSVWRDCPGDLRCGLVPAQSGGPSVPAHLGRRFEGGVTVPLHYVRVPVSSCSLSPPRITVFLSKTPSLSITHPRASRSGN